MQEENKGKPSSLLTDDISMKPEEDFWDPFVFFCSLFSSCSELTVKEFSSRSQP